MENQPQAPDAAESRRITTRGTAVSVTIPFWCWLFFELLFKRSYCRYDWAQQGHAKGRNGNPHDGQSVPLRAHHWRGRSGGCIAERHSIEST
jgi:hypothetical protein